MTIFKVLVLRGTITLLQEKKSFVAKNFRYFVCYSLIKVNLEAKYKYCFKIKK